MSKWLDLIETQFRLGKEVYISEKHHPQSWSVYLLNGRYEYGKYPTKEERVLNYSYLEEHHKYHYTMKWADGFSYITPIESLNEINRYDQKELFMGYIKNRRDYINYFAP